ncbi:MAG TPA: hypothetical protein DCP53_00990 [Elusimicrobia bacterium]|nr:hypothetical protein [Elusimicrobiota bacterium]
MKDLMQIIGPRIKELRHKRGITQEELASRANLHHTFVAHIERGKKVCSIKTLQKIAFALGVSVAFLLCDTKNVKDVNYDMHTKKLLSFIKDKTDNEKELLYSVAQSIFKHTQRK